VKPYREHWTVRPGLWLYRKVVGRLLYGWMGKLKTFGEEKVPLTGGLLILPNHLSVADPPLVQVVCPRRIYYMANSEIWEWPEKGSDDNAPGSGHKFSRWLANYYGAFPVQVKSPDRAALKRAVELLKAGECVCIFPEGGTSPGGIQPLFSGPALIARQSGCQVQCLGISGTEQIVAHQSVKVQRAKTPVIARWGDPRQPGEREGAAELMDWVAQELSRLSGHPVVESADSA
jgi:1-acyl-sn-glycerol-3-phosphate acyltransferase